MEKHPSDGRRSYPRYYIVKYPLIGLEQVNNTSEEISYNQNSAEVIDHTCDYNGINLINIEEEADVTAIHSINTTNYISMNDDKKFIHKHYVPFLSAKNHEYLSF